MKRKTKAQREAEQLHALTQRIRDIYSGAGEGEWPTEEDERYPTATELSRIVPAVIQIFLNDDQAWMAGARTLGHYESPEDLAEFLFQNGVRA